jgi:adenylate kinase family enzyme
MELIMNKKRAVITIGCSASGKSTYAKSLVDEFDYHRIERDLYREFIMCVKDSNFNKNHEKINLWELWKWKWESDVNECIDKGIDFAYHNDMNIICSDTNLNKDHRNTLKLKLEALGYEVEYKVFGEDLSLDVLWKRDLYRKNSVGHAVIAKQYEQFRKEFPKYQLKDVSDKPECIIFDVDGTLATMCRRSPYDWDKVHLDTYNEMLFIAMIAYQESGYKIIVMSGRDSICKEQTRDWIVQGAIENGASCGFEFDLYMRAEGDQRKDNIVKAELFTNHVDGNYKVKAVFDDRPIMVREWLEFGFDVYCHGNQYVEF